MFGLLNLIPAPLQWALMAALAAGAAAVVYSYNGALRQNEALKAEVARLETNIGRMKSVEDTLRKNLELKDATIKAIDGHAEAFGKNLAEACEVWERVKGSDTPVEDVLEALKEKNREP